MRKNHILFIAAIIMGRKSLLKPDKYKQIIIDSLKYLKEKEKIDVYAFVIMPNHIHILWKIQEPYLLQNVKRDFLKYTSQMIKMDLVKKHPDVLIFF